MKNGGMTERRKITPNPKMQNGGKSPIILEWGTLKLEQGNKSLKVTTLRAKSTLLVLQYNFQGFRVAPN